MVKSVKYDNVQKKAFRLASREVYGKYLDEEHTIGSALFGVSRYRRIYPCGDNLKIKGWSEYIRLLIPLSLQI